MLRYRNGLNPEFGRQPEAIAVLCWLRATKQRQATSINELEGACRKDEWYRETKNTSDSRNDLLKRSSRLTMTSKTHVSRWSLL
jgi:hypothetical protein